LIDKLSFFKAATDGGAASAEEERLMQLFQNRAGLKKAYADLQDELHLLRDRLKQQEGATIRVQEQLDALGELLADPATAFSALVFFQLRSLWKVCHRQLTKFAGDLVRVQETRESARHRADCEALRRSRLSDADEQVAAAQAALQEQQSVLAATQAQLERLSAIWHYFERRRLQKDLEAQRALTAAAESHRLRTEIERRAIADEAPPGFPGISLAARRNINLAIIGYAELLCEHVDAFGLTAKAKEAIARRVHEMSFGSRSECESYMQRVQNAITAVTHQKMINASVKLKLERLRAGCDYRNTADTVPTADSIVAPGHAKAPRRAAGADTHANAAVAAPPVWNVLADDYWDVYTLLLR
jgi:hypothetical protein